jgi:hypothetical protein
LLFVKLNPPIQLNCLRPITSATQIWSSLNLSGVWGLGFGVWGANGFCLSEVRESKVVRLDEDSKDEEKKDD